jgi:hypothetical protein
LTCEISDKLAGIASFVGNIGIKKPEADCNPGIDSLKNYEWGCSFE